MPKRLSAALPNRAYFRAIPLWRTRCCGVQKSFHCVLHNGISFDRQASLMLRSGRSSERDTPRFCSERVFRFLMSLAVLVTSTKHISPDRSNASLEKLPPGSFKGKSSCRFYTRLPAHWKLYLFGSAQESVKVLDLCGFAP